MARALDLMSDRFFSPTDVRVALASNDEKVRHLAIQRAIPGTENICTMLAAATPQ